MERRNFLKSTALAGLAGTVLSSCAGESSNKETEENTIALQPIGTIIHSVFFWLKEDLTEDDEKDFLHFFEALRQVPGVRTLQYGKPAPTTARPVVDNSFSYNLIVTFAHMDDINTYETHPQHLAASEKYGKYWTKVQVRDMVIA